MTEQQAEEMKFFERAFHLYEADVSAHECLHRPYKISPTMQLAYDFWQIARQTRINNHYDEDEKE